MSQQGTFLIVRKNMQYKNFRFNKGKFFWTTNINNGLHTLTQNLFIYIQLQNRYGMKWVLRKNNPTCIVTCKTEYKKPFVKPNYRMKITTNVEITVILIDSHGSKIISH